MLAVLMLLSLFISAIPVRAHADELDELKAKKEELSAKVQSIKEKLDGLEEEKTTVLERKGKRGLQYPGPDPPGGELCRAPDRL